MNRKRRRAFEKLMKYSGFIKDGDKVMVNTRRVMSRSDFDRMQDEYKEFVSDSEGRVFTARCVREREDGFSPYIELVESPKWMFVQDDLVAVRPVKGKIEIK